MFETLETTKIKLLSLKTYNKIIARRLKETQQYLSLSKPTLYAKNHLLQAD